MAQLDSLLTLRQLRYFVSVVEHRSISGAARALHVAQPSLSRQITLLEEALNEHLVVRHADGVSTTESGDRLYTLAHMVLDRINGARADIRGEARAPEGKVSMAVPSMAGNDLVTAVVQTCKRDIPLVDLQVVDGFSFQNSNMLTTGLVDFGVIYDAERISGLHHEALFIENLYLVRASKLAAKDKRKTISFEEACGFPLVVGPKETHLRQYLDHMASTLGHGLNPTYEQRSMGVIAAFVRSGMAATISNWPSIKDNGGLRGATVQEIVQPSLGRMVSMGYPESRPLSHAGQATYDIVKRLVTARWTKGLWHGRKV
ncbi:LysR family transcriptional regulator [Acidovorax sp.]|uniref:LysR family transcriptional regulator n=1 Tax=Acidovorax sp. TaxID=1872122 RepID=UPI00262DAEEB|nr:LysR family transcriptional regulator [Acidovorax sp.]